MLELVGMRAAALRARLLNSALSVRRSGACGELNLLINARMSVGHAGVAIEVVQQAEARFGGLFGPRTVFPKKTSSRLSDAGGGLVYY